MNDAISRLAVIQIIEKMRARIGHNLERSVGRAMIEILDEVGEDVGKLPSAQPTFDARDTQYNLPIGTDLISRQAAIDAISCDITITGRRNAELVAATIGAFADRIKALPPAQPEIIRCKDCKYWNKGSCEYCEHVVNCQDYMIGDIETKAEHFCGYAERREVNNESN